MRKYLIVATMVLVVAFSGCSRESDDKKTLKTNVDKEVSILGKTADDFNSIKWAGFENEDKKSSFSEVEIKNLHEEDSVVDAYSKGDKSYIVVENSDGKIVYNTVKDNRIAPLKTREEAIDESVISKLDDKSEFWGYERQGEYLAVINSSGTQIYKNDEKLFELDGVASIQDIDGNGVYEVVGRNSEGKGIRVYELKDDKLLDVWNYELDNETFHGDVQIGDLNQDGIREIYVDDINGNIQKFILSRDGFSKSSSLPVDMEGKEGACFIVDINLDGKMDIITQEEGKKPVLHIQK